MSIFTPPHTLNTPRWNNMRVGLLGGSFNPPHKGHLHISLAALNSLQLDAIWWLVTPQNPLKGDITPLPIEEPIALSQELITHPKILVTDIEKDKQASEQSEARKLQVGSGDRSQRIRTYNYPQGRVTDHRIGLTLYDLSNIINGDIQKIIDELMLAENTVKLKELGETI